MGKYKKPIEKGKGKEKVVIQRRWDVYVPELDGPRPGGPDISDLLISYDAHVASDVWSYGSKDVCHLNCINISYFRFIIQFQYDLMILYLHMLLVM